MYYYQPTKWECNKHKQNHLGRPVNIGGSWDFIPEEEFQQRHAETLALLEKRYGAAYVEALK